MPSSLVLNVLLISPKYLIFSQILRIDRHVYDGTISLESLKYLLVNDSFVEYLTLEFVYLILLPFLQVNSILR